MSAYNRYSFTKNVYPNYIVLLYKKGKYYTYGKDRKKLINYQLLTLTFLSVFITTFI